MSVLPPDAQVRSISILAWCDLSRTGDAPPVTILLDGDSMRPLIRRGRDPVTIRPMDDTLRRGDVVLFHHGEGRYVVHRVRRIRGRQVQTLGDNCWQADPWISVEQVLGQAVCVRRGGRSIRLDNALARAWGRCWMACRPLRNLLRRCRGFAVRLARKIGLHRR